MVKVRKKKKTKKKNCKQIYAKLKENKIISMRFLLFISSVLPLVLILLIRINSIYRSFVTRSTEDVFFFKENQ